MPIGRQLAVFGQTAERLRLPEDAFVIDVVQGGGLEREEPAVDPGTIPLRLLAEVLDAGLVFGQAERAIPAGRLYGGQRRARTLGAVKGE